MLGYLLSVAELLYSEGSSEGEAPSGSGKESEESLGLLARAFARVDGHRREKAARMRPGRGQAACLGAGLLLQLAVASESLAESAPVAAGLREEGVSVPAENAEVWCPGHDGSRSRGDVGNLGYVGSGKRECLRWERFGMTELLERLDSVPPVPLCYIYGEKGKPYLKGCPFYFSISHSGEYVLCVLDREEIGADIQQHRSCGAERLADRFFTKQEQAALERAFRKGAGQEEFFRLWVRKEAYGKLTGGGIGEAVGRNLLTDGERLPEARGLIWEKTPEITGYSMAVCKYRD